MKAITLEQCVDLLDRLAYPEKYESESFSTKWHSGDGPFEDWANEIADKYRSIVEEADSAVVDSHRRDS